ncbi:MAG: hypothetical protein LBU76_02740 [Azoarcus sp.]|nr:hypothetical protein [Azoarcus sp.]
MLPKALKIGGTVIMSEIEVVISDSLLSVTSMFGHVAITVDWVAYTRAHSGYFTYHHADYMLRQRKIRSSIGYFLYVTYEEKQKIKKELERRMRENKPYSFMNNDCVTNVIEVLKVAGIEASDVRGFGATSPVALARRLTFSGRFIRKMSYPKHLDSPE